MRHQYETRYVVSCRKPSAVQGRRMQYQTKGKISYTQGIPSLKEKRIGNNKATLFKALHPWPQARTDRICKLDFLFSRLYKKKYVYFKWYASASIRLEQH
jgi:hypothetical protein